MKGLEALLLALLVSTPLVFQAGSQYLVVTDWYGHPLAGAIVYLPGKGNVTADDLGRVRLPEEGVKPSQSYKVYYETPLGTMVETVSPTEGAGGELHLRLRLRIAHLFIQYISGSKHVNVSVMASGVIIAETNRSVEVDAPVLIPSNNTGIPVPLEILLGSGSHRLRVPLASAGPSVRIPVYVDGNTSIMGVEPQGSPSLISLTNDFYRCGLLGDSYYGALTLFFQGEVDSVSLVKGVVDNKLVFMGNVEGGENRYTVYYPLKNCVYGYVVKQGEEVFLEIKASVGGTSSYYEALISIHGSPTSTVTGINTQSNPSGGAASGRGMAPGVVEAGGESRGSEDAVGLVAVSAMVIAGLAAALIFLSHGGSGEPEE